MRSINKVRTSILALTILFYASAVYSQVIRRSTTSIAGSSQVIVQNQKSYFISQTIGQQSLIGTVMAKNQFVLQGFQQPMRFTIGEPELNSDLEALVFPNPFQQSLDILFREEIESDIQVIVHDVMGRQLLHETHDASQSLRLPLEFLAGGSYLLHVAVKNKGFTRKIIKQ